MSLIISIGTALPPYQHKQQAILDFMLGVYQPDERERRKLEILYKKTGIDTRYSAIADYTVPTTERSFYPNSQNLEPFPTIEQRMEGYRQAALPLALEAIQSAQQQLDHTPEITHLITVSCTGMSAPGLDIALLKALQLPSHTPRTSVNFMGCYAGFHALKQADLICQTDPEAVVLVTCVELCTLHFQKVYDTDNLTANALFADGAAAALVVSDKQAQQQKHKGLHLKRFYSEIMPEGASDMAWEIGSTGFLMTLSSYIPQLIQKGIAPLINHTLASLQIEVKDIDFWAIHPGGKRILEVVQQVFQLVTEQLAGSFDTLKNYGNMSSVTIFFVWQYLWQKQIDWEKTTRILGVGFGPGLTIETALLETKMNL
ncbi:MAG: type III polyketide synthase [Thermonemataceae bacterium]